MDIISVSNQKGGVSKTGVSFNLGTALALKHSKKVLLIDLDPQANLSEYLKYEPDGKPTLTQLVMTACTGGRLTPEMVGSAIRHNDTAGVDYIPSDINLANSEDNEFSILNDTEKELVAAFRTLPDDKADLALKMMQALNR